MGLNLKNAKGGMKNNTPPLEAGGYPSTLIHIVDLGLQEQAPYKGKEKDPIHKVLLTYELADAFLLDEDGQELPDKPRFLSEIMPVYPPTAEKAKLTQRYNTFDPDNHYEADLSKCIGTPVNVTVVLNERNGRIYENIAGVSRLRAKDIDKHPDPVNTPVVFDLEDPDMEAFNLLPEWIQKLIKENLNFNGSKLQHMLGDETTPNKNDVADPPSNVNPDDDEENPY